MRTTVDGVGCPSKISPALALHYHHLCNFARTKQEKKRKEAAMDHVVPLLTDSEIWKQIERSESYLVCCMFEKAASLSSSVIQCLCKSTSVASSIEHVQLADMMESAGMVLVQSLKELGRTSEILIELKNLFGTAVAIPFQVLLTGSCFQIAEGSYSGLREFLEEFLCKWRLVDGQFYALADAEPNGAYLKGLDGHSILEIEKYLELVEVYAVTLLGLSLNDTDVAIAWLEKAELPEENRQELSRRLRSLYSLKATNSSQDVEKPSKANKSEANFDPSKDSTLSRVKGSSITSKASYQHNERNISKQTILELNKRVEPCFWWYRTITLRFGNARLVISRGKMVLWSSLFFFTCYILRKKQATLKRIASQQASAVKKALVDMWELAFSVQVNPLAAVQPLPPPTQGSRG